MAEHLGYTILCTPISPCQNPLLQAYGVLLSWLDQMLVILGKLTLSFL